MDPAVLGTRLASSVIVPALKKLLVQEGPGAGLTDRPVRISGLVSFRGEKRTLTDKDVRRIAGQLVAGSLVTTGGRPPFPAEETIAVTDALTATLLAFGELTMDDVQAVRLGHHELARRLRAAAPAPQLSTDAAYFLASATEWACLHILQFFTQRSTFVARTLVEQSRSQAELRARTDELIARLPTVDTQDLAFERRYLAYATEKHSRLTIYGIDLQHSPGRWPLDAAYLSLEATGSTSGPPLGLSPGLPAAISADQLFAAHERVLLRGVAGSGKTTLIQWLAVSAAGDDPCDRMAYLADRIPFVLPLRTLTRHGERLPAPAAFLTATGCPLAGAQPAGWETRVLGGGRALVLVDGIDEVPEPERERTRTWLRDLVAAFPANRWLITTRPSAVPENWLAEDGFTQLTLSPMTTAEVTSFITRWHSAAATGDPAEDALLPAYESGLLDAVRAKPDLGRLATNPLMCGLLCALHRDRRGYLPHGRKELYESALSMLLVRRDRERDMTGPELTEEPQLQLLQRLAYWLIRNGRTEMDRTRAETIVAEFLPAIPAAAALGDATTVLRHFLVRTGLLIEPAPGTVHFVHRTFQDYLGARAAVESGDFGALSEHAADDQWADVIRMAVAQARPRERAELLGLLMASPDTRAHLLAMTCLEHATELDPAVRTAIEARAAELIPPSTVEEARALAEAGPLVLELLPGPGGLSDAEAVAVTGTAVLVGTEAAVPVLTRFRTCAQVDVRLQLAAAWHRHDAGPYARDVLAHVDSEDFYVVVKSWAELRALPLLGHRHRVVLQGVFPMDRALAALPPTVRKVGFEENPALDDLRPLAALGHLDRLGLYDCPAVTDFSPLAELGLDDLDLAGATFARTGLDELTSLRRVSLSPTNHSGWLDLLPREAPLTSLAMGRRAILGTGLRAVRRWPTLQFVALNPGLSPLTPDDWSALSALPALTEVALQRDVLTGLPDAFALPRLQRLYVSGLRGDEDLSGIGRACPEGVGVHLHPTVDSPFTADRYAEQFPGSEVTVHIARPLIL
ncbi:NACHT domain-containing protein [Streptomyces sp. NPDC102467]|uniref:NACHT domain-containing protein n=1 Tax=Streptomyces sp. NPDC102467 TaxID=3366179 RepID=UPI00382ACE3C